MLVTCPHCNTDLAVTPEFFGQDSINRALRDLGENQIPDSAKKKRGFFGR